MLNMIIREAGTEDLEAILSLYARTYDKGQKLEPDAADKQFAKIQSYPDYKIYVAVTKEQIVGTFSLIIIDNLAHMGRPFGIVESVVVDPDFQDRGIGRQMMRYAMHLCSEADCTKMALSSWVELTGAHKFYKSLGFKIHGYSFVIE